MKLFFLVKWVKMKGSLNNVEG
jgi:hypothetical protein